MVYWILIPSCTQVGCFYLLIFNGLNWFDLEVSLKIIYAK